MTTPADETPDPPPTRREVVTETFHGTEVRDPYRWLEDDDEAVREWAEAQNEYVDVYLETPTRDALRLEFEELAEVTEYGPVEVANGRYFQKVRAPGDEHGRLFVRETPGSEGRSPDDGGTVLVDPNEWPTNDDEAEPTRSMSWFLPSHDGEHVAYGVVEGGDEQVDVHVASVPDGEEVAVREDCGRVSRAFVGFDPVSPGMVAWDADGEGLYYVATGTTGVGEGAGSGTETGAGTEGTDKELRHWRIDGSEETLLELDDEHGWSRVETDPEGGSLADTDPEGWPLVRTDPASGTLAVAFHDVSGTDWYVRVDGEFRPVVADSDAETFVAFHDGTVFLQTDHEAPRKRVLSCSLARFREGDLAFADCETVLAEREAVLQSFVVTPDHLVAHYLEGAHSRLAVYDHEGNHVRDLPLADCASASRLRNNADAEEVFYREESFHRPPALVRADPATGDRRELTRVDVVARVDVEVPENLVVHREFVESTGGVEVPVFVCHRADVERDGENPAVLHGYGGFRSSRPPSFDRFRVPFLADGGVYAQVCARGGHEYGEEWHEDGMLADKQHTFDDFVAAGEFLCSAGYTNPDRLAVDGRSNGGLSVGAVVIQRPDLWTAARCAVPLLDVLRFHRLGMGEAWTSEYGDPEDPKAFEYLREYSPYHNVESGVKYPPVLFTTAEGDTRVHPGHARKMAARMQAEADGGPFLLRTEIDAGHGVGKPTSGVVAEELDKWTFLYDRLGMGEADSTE